MKQFKLDSVSDSWADANPGTQNAEPAAHTPQLPAAAAVAVPAADAGAISALCRKPALLCSAPGREEEGLHGVHRQLRPTNTRKQKRAARSSARLAAV
jgi:5-deoxy-D-glucuronate isomerase